VIDPINDQDYVEKDWVYGCGFLNSESALLKTKLFDRHYFYQDAAQFNYLTLIKMIAMQNTLKQMQIPYLFTYFRDYEADLATIPHLYQQLDQSRIYNQQNIYTITQTNNWYDKDGLHPGVEAHQRWAELITSFIC
jgi:lysophospholipase L1-like esterase